MQRRETHVYVRCTCHVLKDKDLESGFKRTATCVAADTGAGGSLCPTADLGDWDFVGGTGRRLCRLASGGARVWCCGTQWADRM